MTWTGPLTYHTNAILKVLYYKSNLKKKKINMLKDKNKANILFSLMLLVLAFKMYVDGTMYII